MSNIQKITAVVTSVAIGTPITLNTTPLQGGFGRECILRVPTLPLTSTVKLQGAGRQDSGTVPASDSTAWTDIVSITSASPIEQEIELPLHFRWNCPVLDADGPDVVMYLEGIQ